MSRPVVFERARLYHPTDMLWAFAITFILTLLVPDRAYAWGPVTHVELVRGTLHAATPALSFIASSGMEVFWALFYGSLAPDLFLAKNRQPFPLHTHNWDRAFTMLDAASTPETRAFCLGYLTHLAGDVIAHNVFVPYKMVEVPFNSRRQHAYWEFRFETVQPREAWEMVEALKAMDFSHLNRFLEQHQRPTILPFYTNLAMTRSLARAATGNAGRRLLDRMERRSEVGIAPLEIELFQDLCLRMVQDTLEEGQSSEAVRYDPRGLERIRHAKAVTTSLRKLWRRGLGGRAHYKDLAVSSARNFRTSLLRDHLEEAA